MEGAKTKIADLELRIGILTVENKFNAENSEKWKAAEMEKLIKERVKQKKKIKIGTQRGRKSRRKKKQRRIVIVIVMNRGRVNRG